MMDNLEKMDILEKIENVLNEAKKGDEVKVTGDRGSGAYSVVLGKRRRDLEDIPEEQIYEATIKKLIKNPYDYKINDKVFVIPTTSYKGFWGAIDPEVEG